MFIRSKESLRSDLESREFANQRSAFEEDMLTFIPDDQSERRSLVSRPQIRFRTTQQNLQMNAGLQEERKEEEEGRMQDRDVRFLEG